jgi:Fe-S-cluster containining protein
MSDDKPRGGWGGADALAWLTSRPAAPRSPVSNLAGSNLAGSNLAGPSPAAPNPSPAAPSEAAPVRTDVAHAAYFQARDALRTSRTAAAIAAAAAAAANVADRAWAEARPAVEARKQPGFACAAGCGWCCHQQVALAPAEALAIARHVQQSFAPSDLAALKARLAALDSQSRGRSVRERAQLKAPCAFLDNGRCSIYAVRPLRCRGVYSRNAEHCRWAMENPEALFGQPDRHAAPGPYPVEPAKLMDSALTGLARALHDQGLPWEALELTAALRLALDAPDAADAYLAGQPVFAGAELPARESQKP